MHARERERERERGGGGGGEGREGEGEGERVCVCVCVCTCASLQAFQQFFEGSSLPPYSPTDESGSVLTSLLHRGEVLGVSGQHVWVPS